MMTIVRKGFMSDTILISVHIPNVGIILDVSIGHDENGTPVLLADPIPLTADRANEIAKGLIDWAKEQTE